MRPNRFSKCASVNAAYFQHGMSHVGGHIDCVVVAHHHAGRRKGFRRTHKRWQPDGQFRCDHLEVGLFLGWVLVKGNDAPLANFCNDNLAVALKRPQVKHPYPIYSVFELSR